MRLGLTGGIGSGKSTVAAFFAACGARLFDADAVSRELTGAQGAAMPALAQAFGADVVAADGSLRDIIVANRAGAYERSRVLARAIAAERPGPGIERAVEPAVSAFLDHAIGKMVTICRAIRQARGLPLA